MRKVASAGAVSLAVLVAGCGSPAGTRAEPSASVAPQVVPATTASDLPSPKLSVSPSPSPSGIGEQTCVVDGNGYGVGSWEVGSKSFCSLELNVSFLYPAEWEENPHASGPSFKGPSGFVTVVALRIEETGTFEGVCDSLAHNHRGDWFGADPTIEMLKVAGEPACLILPSADQHPVYDRQARILVHYPEPFEYLGQYQYLDLWADADHIEAIVYTLGFPASE